jgi:hypothetical protein
MLGYGILTSDLLRFLRSLVCLAGCLDGFGRALKAGRDQGRKTAFRTPIRKLCGKLWMLEMLIGAPWLTHRYCTDILVTPSSPIHLDNHYVSFRLEIVWRTTGDDQVGTHIFNKHDLKSCSFLFSKSYGFVHWGVSALGQRIGERRRSLRDSNRFLTESKTKSINFSILFKTSSNRSAGAS